jgi:hypothetical protein
MEVGVKLLTEKAQKQIASGKNLIGDPWLLSYWTKGGTYMIANNGKQNDDLLPHDLIAVTRDGQVVAVRPTTNPDLVEEVREALEHAPLPDQHPKIMTADITWCAGHKQFERLNE